ncbi:MAG: dephospho-CoA kinase [Acidobacteriaceae bacterium]|nr:dephospho-CoA kinase [Acidobacteriaceae bacterium]
MLKVGLTGGYASGKSFVAAELERLGCFVLRADLIGHAVLEPGGAAYSPTLHAFGPAILAPDHAIDRKKLASVVFENPELLEKLNSFVHPAVIAREDQMIEEYKTRNPQGVAIVEAAILIETGRDRMFDRIILTACDRETQIARGVKRDHLTREQVLARLARQLPLEEKKRHAHYVIDTSGEKQDTLCQVKVIFEALERLAHSNHP